MTLFIRNQARLCRWTTDKNSDCDQLIVLYLVFTFKPVHSPTGRTGLHFIEGRFVFKEFNTKQGQMVLEVL